MASYLPLVFDILQEDRVTTEKEKMGEFDSITLEKRPALLVCVADKPCHIQVLWVKYKVPILYCIPSIWYGKVIDFYKYVVE